MNATRKKNIIEFWRSGATKVKIGVWKVSNYYSKIEAEQIFVKGEIIHNEEELELLKIKINKINQRINLNLINKTIPDFDKASVFHEKYNDANFILETDKGEMFWKIYYMCLECGLLW